MDSAEEYLRAAHEMRSWTGGALRLVSAANRPKYRQQVQAGFGFYLDMFLNDATNRYYRGPLHGSRLARLERNLGFARDATDEYVWVYGEQCRWWGKPLNLPLSVGKGRLWEEAMPGITRAIAYVRDPILAAQDDLARLRAGHALTNLARNADFARPAGPEAGALPAEFGAWQEEKTSSGKFAWDAGVGNGAGRAGGVRWGCLTQARDVKPGEAYAVRADCLPRGASNPTLVVRWQTAENRWTREKDDCTSVFRPIGEGAVESAPDARALQYTSAQAERWQRAFGVVTVPPDVGKLVILLNVTGQIAESDVCWFDEVALYRLRAGSMLHRSARPGTTATAP